MQTFRDSRRDRFNAHNAEGGVHLQRLPQGENPDGFQVVFRDLPPRTVAYIRVIDPFRPDAVTGAFDRLLAWADARGLADGQWLGYMWEDPEVVAIEDCRYDAAVVVDDGRTFQPSDEIGRFDFPAMRVAEIEICGDIHLEQRALDWLYGTWLPESGLEPAFQPCFEAWKGRPFAHGTEHFELSVHLAIED